MNKGIIIFLLIVPALLALGFDAYLYYKDQEEGFKLTDLGWLWIHYDEASHNYSMEQMGDKNWVQYMVPLLKLPLVAVALIFSGILLFVIIMIKGLSSIGSGNFLLPARRKKKDLGRDRGSKKQFKYNRK